MADNIVEERTQIAPLLDKYKDAPLVGLEYIVEVSSSAEEDEPVYHCFLSDRPTDAVGLIPCIISPERRLAYLVSISTTLALLRTPLNRNAIFRRWARSLARSRTFQLGRLPRMTPWRT